MTVVNGSTLGTFSFVSTIVVFVEFSNKFKAVFINTIGGGFWFTFKALFFARAAGVFFEFRAVFCAWTAWVTFIFPAVSVAGAAEVFCTRKAVFILVTAIGIGVHETVEPLAVWWLATTAAKVSAVKPIFTIFLNLSGDVKWFLGAFYWFLNALLRFVVAVEWLSTVIVAIAVQPFVDVLDSSLLSVLLFDTSGLRCVKPFIDLLVDTTIDVLVCWYLE